MPIQLGKIASKYDYGIKTVIEMVSKPFQKGLDPSPVNHARAL